MNEWIMWLIWVGGVLSFLIILFLLAKGVERVFGKNRFSRFIIKVVDMVGGSSFI